MNKLSLFGLGAVALSAASIFCMPAAAEPIALKTGQETLTRARQFELRKGVVYYGPASAERSELKPLASLAGKFTTPPKFRSIQADSSIVLAEAEDGRLFMLEFPTPGTLAAKVAQQWSDRFGMPFNSTLKLPRGAKAWSFSNRNIDVGQAEDAQGQAFFWGIAGCSTIYALSGDGRRLHYADPWLPADFSREVCLPDTGTFIVENFSSSASSLFVIGKNGEMFTRIEDYDLNGGTPFYEFHYDPVPPHGLPGTDPQSEYKPRRIFTADWQTQPTIALQGKARITSDITVIQNGRGNAGRELRVAGIDAAGTPGYYYKAIHDGLKPLNSAAWKFKSAEVKIQPAHLLRVDLSEQAKRDNRRPLETLTLTGTKFALEGVERRDLTVGDFKFSWACGPALIAFKDAAGRVFTAKLHLADGWAPFAQAERYGANDSPAHTGDGQIPFIRNYKGTLELPEALRNDRILGPLQFKSFALAVMVGPGWARIWADKQFELQFGAEPYLPLFSSRLAQESMRTNELKDAESLKRGLQTNAALYADLAREREDLHERKGVAMNIQAGFETFDTLGQLTWAGPGLMQAPYWNAVQHGRAIVSLGNAWTYGMEEYTRADYTMARSILRNRICADLARLQRIEPADYLVNREGHSITALCSEPTD